ncbi:MAG: TetR family transcriptional regulator [Sphingobacteriaceae bacterium]|jgi:AcrR family transcriptional regulator|nr:TetR family transcriptional regulator [Sphingobacteriaceae bacterium]
MQDKTDKKDHILDAAQKLFAQNGFDGTSTRSIASEANVNMAMISYYFGSKDGLYQAVLERRFDGFRQTLSDINDQDISSWDKLYQCIDIYSNRIMGDNSFHQLIHRELSLHQRSDIKDFITDNLLRNANEVKRIIVEGIENGTFRKVDPEMTVATIFGTKYYVINASVLASKLLGEDINDEKTLNESVKPRIKAHLTDLLKAHLTKP